MLVFTNIVQVGWGGGDRARIHKHCTCRVRGDSARIHEHSTNRLRQGEGGENSAGIHKH